MRVWVIVVLALMVLAPNFYAASAPDLSVLPAEFRGIVLYPDGETAADGLSVRVWDQDTEEVVFKTKTDKDGIFQIPELPEGSHYVTVGPVKIDMRLLTARAGITPQPHGLVVVVPRQLPVANILIPTAAASLAPEIMSP